MTNINEREKKRKEFWLIKFKEGQETKKKMDEIRNERMGKKLDFGKPIPYEQLVNAVFRYPPAIDILKRAKIDWQKEKKK